jgi:hypothetical protein
MLWVKACWHHFEMINFVSKHAAHFTQCTKSQLPSPVEKFISCLRKDFNAFCCINDDFGGDLGHDCAVIDCVFIW